MANIRRREAHRSTADILITSIEVVLQQQVIDFDSLSSEVKALEFQREKIFSFDDRIQANIKEDSALNKDVLDAAKNQQKIEKCLLRAKNHLKPPSISTAGTVSNDPNSISNVKIPLIKLEFFDGDPMCWPSFWDIFETSVHKRTDLSGAQKFTYLKGQLKDNAFKLLQGFSITNVNYDEALNLLKETYGKPEKIIISHLHAIMDLEPTSTTLSDLNRFRSQFECHFRALRTLKSDIDKNGYVIATILLRKLHPKIRDNITRASNICLWTMDVFAKALNAEIQIMQTTSQEFNSKSDQENMKNFSNQKEKYKSKSVNNLTTSVSSNERSKQTKCKYCYNGHLSINCKKYSSAKNRMERVKELGLCDNCLGSHTGQCKSKYKCFICQMKHHTSICLRVSADTKKEDSEEIAKTSTVAWQGSSNLSVALPTAIISIKTNMGIRRIHAIFDQCAQKSMMLESMAKELNLPIINTKTFCVDGYGVRGTKTKYDSVRMHVTNSDDFDCNVEAILVPHLPSRIHTPGLLATTKELMKDGINLADKKLRSDHIEDISVLIAGDYYWNFIKGFTVRNNVHLLQSHFGDIVSGPVKETREENSYASNDVITVMHISNENCETIKSSLNKLWSLDSIGISEEKDLEKNEVLKVFEENISYMNGKYTSRLPWKKNHPDLPRNYGMSRALLSSSLERLRKKPEMLKHYNNVITEQLNREFIEKVNSSNDNFEGELVHYLPHHSVEKASITTPLRIVFNCSAGKPSLNDCLYTGPSLNTDTVDIILRFRLCRYVCLSDIAKAFLMISLHKSDRDVTRFLWPKDPFNPSSKIDTYRFKTILFGATCSQFILNATIRHHLQAVKTKTAHKILRNIYVDNLFESSDSEEYLKKFYEESNTLLSGANLYLREWCTNSPSLQSDIEVHENGTKGDSCIQGVLGMEWNKETDKFGFQKRNYSTSDATKRNVLSLASKIFDPLGYICPVVIQAKMFLQDLWKQNLSWDQILDDSDQLKWKNISKQLCDATLIHVPRQVVRDERVTLHAFSDSSMKAYGAALYLRDSHGCNLVLAKARVAPIKILTIPQLELTSIVIAARLVERVKKAYSEELIIEQVHMWTDSEINLYWIHQRTSLKRPFVQSRVDEIHKLVPDAIWHHVATNENPSDLCTRGADANKLLKNKLWFEGPPWLIIRNNFTAWMPTKNDVTSKQKNATVLATNIEKQKSFIEYERFSHFGKLVKVFALILRFAKKLRNQNTPSSALDFHDHFFTPTELKHAEIGLIVKLQHDEFRDEIEAFISGKPTNLCKQLNLFMTDDGLVRCKGRIEYSNLPYDAKHPILMPGKHHATILLIEKIHEERFHAGLNDVVTTMRQRFWITCIRQRVKSVVRSCVVCKKLHGSHYRVPEVPSLPPTRVNDAKPFQIVGVDYSGAYIVKDSNSNIKTYICLITCAVTRALHLELVEDNSAEAFLRAFRRFVGRRGSPQYIYSDNSTTFVASAKFIKELVQHRSVKEYFSSHRCEWRFIPKRAPWFGGFYERLIGLTKSTLKKVLGRSLIAVEEFRTLLIEVESILNDRPMTYDGGNLDDLTPITPNQLIFGYRLDAPLLHPLNESDEDFETTEFLNKRQRRTAKIIHDFNDRWKLEYLTSLRHYEKKAGKGSLQAAVGDVVIIYDEGPRLKWRLGLIEELTVGRDGLVRSAMIKTSNIRTSRPIARLYPLEIRSSVIPSDQQSSVEDQSNTLQRKRLPREAADRARAAIRSQFDNDVV